MEPRSTGVRRAYRKRGIPPDRRACLEAPQESSLHRVKGIQKAFVVSAEHEPRCSRGRATGVTAAQIIELAKNADFSTNRRLRPNSAVCSKRCYRTARSTAEVCAPHTLPRSTYLLGGTKLEIGGESGIRTHGRVSPTHAFQACSFNHSDISPFRINDLRTVWNSVAQNPPLNRSGPRCRLSSAIYERRYD